MKISHTDLTLGSPQPGITHIRVDGELVGYIKLIRNPWGGEYWHAYYAGAYATENSLPLRVVARESDHWYCLKNFVEVYEDDRS